jgi:DNA anti-recombination protein RmuC
MDNYDVDTKSEPTESLGHEPGPESLDKVRDILFGSQMRMVESRFHNLEERLLQEQRSLRADFGRQLGELNTALRSELDQAEQRLAAERQRRQEELQALNHELHEAVRSLERRHMNLEQAAGMADADLRDQLLQHSSAITSEIARLSERVSAELDRSVKQLDGVKLDTSLLASLLGEMATRLGGNGREQYPG